MLQHVYIKNEGQNLLGAYHQPPPDTPRRPLGIVMLHGWAGYRVGAHQMFKRLSAWAEEDGFVSLRFDFRGRGDSEGDAEDTTLTTMISDTVAAVKWLVEESGLQRIALVGDCSGAEVAIGAGPLCPQVDTMILWSAPMVGTDRSEADRAKKWHIIGEYFRKLFRRETWSKLFSGSLQFDMIKKAILRGGRGAGEDGAEIDETIDWRKRFVNFGGETYFVYGGNDPVAEPSLDYYASLCRLAGRPFHSHVVEKANHAFYSVAWEEEVMRVTLDWLRSRCQEAGAGIEAAGPC
ncbi:MAG: alpha/beta fold hydrolase [Armatimonadota bacterium]